MTVDWHLMAARASRGDRAAFEAIVRQTQDGLYRLAARLTGSLTDAEDVLQDAYVKAHRALTSGGFDGRADLRTWMYRIVTNSAIDSLRRRTRRKEDELLESARFDSGIGPEARLALSEIEAWLGELPPEQRVVVVLRTIEGLTTPEVARILDVSDEAVEQRLSRGRAALRARRDADD